MSAEEVIADMLNVAKKELKKGSKDSAMLAAVILSNALVLIVCCQKRDALSLIDFDERNAIAKETLDGLVLNVFSAATVNKLEAAKKTEVN